MDRVIYNIGYKGMGSGILSWYPECMECSFTEFAEILRNQESINALWNWAKDSHVPPSSMILMLRIENETDYWNYTIRMINVREYRAHWEQVYGEEWRDPFKKE